MRCGARMEASPQMGSRGSWGRTKGREGVEGGTRERKARTGAESDTQQRVRSSGERDARQVRRCQAVPERESRRQQRQHQPRHEDAAEHRAAADRCQLRRRPDQNFHQNDQLHQMIECTDWL